MDYISSLYRIVVTFFRCSLFGMLRGQIAKWMVKLTDGHGFLPRSLLVHVEVNPIVEVH